MLHDLFAFLVSTFLVAPFQAEVADRLAAARAPAAVVSQVTACAREATPPLVARAANDPWWVVSSSAGVWLGTTRVEDVVAEAAPAACREAVAAARPYLAAAGS